MPLPFEWFLCLRYLRPKRTFVGAITVISILGVMIGVWILVVVIPVMAGFDQMIKEKLMGFNAHIIVSTGNVLWDADSIAEAIRGDATAQSISAIESVEPNVIGPALVETRQRFQVPYLKGISDNTIEVLGLEELIVSGTAQLDWDEVLVGVDLAKDSELLVGDTITVTGPSALRPSDEIVLPRDMRVVGIFQTGFWEFDSGFLIMGIESAQDVYDLSGGAHHLEVMIADPYKADLVARALRERLGPGMRVETWMERNARLFSALAVEKNVMLYLLMSIILVAAFGLCSTLITIVVEKTREIGTLMAMGASPAQVSGVFVAQGLIVGILGSAFGLGLGLIVLDYRNEIVSQMRRWTGVGLLEKDIYHFSEIPALIIPKDLVTIILSAMVICIVASLIPAMRAGRMDPAQALRSS
ncbi:MAG: ABC transporter permease [Verrucomicrobiota bacterium]|jgi:lipoprotein-releasing system permease protein|nr:ABC transporter permease [Verrucomicrobiota bacterium]MDD8050296.1 ABC transporter permease [Verrucomicrobiota bacterium]MDI9383695.1 ABC transporter permease [Verrucomicrobiota bacterium]